MALGLLVAGIESVDESLERTVVGYAQLVADAADLDVRGLKGGVLRFELLDVFLRLVGVLLHDEAHHQRRRREGNDAQPAQRDERRDQGKAEHAHGGVVRRYPGAVLAPGGADRGAGAQCDGDAQQ